MRRCAVRADSPQVRRKRRTARAYTHGTYCTRCTCTTVTSTREHTDTHHTTLRACTQLFLMSITSLLPTAEVLAKWSSVEEPLMRSGLDNKVFLKTCVGVA